jgi:hypothetical protein
MCKIRYMDKLIDELAKGKKTEKILRGGGLVLWQVFVSQSANKSLACLGYFSIKNLSRSS